MIRALLLYLLFGREAGRDAGVRALQRERDEAVEHCERLKDTLRRVIRLLPDERPPTRKPPAR
jgi:hypothetical protein